MSVQINSEIYKSLVTFTSDSAGEWDLLVSNHEVRVVTSCISMHLFQWSAGIQYGAVSS